MRVLTKKNKIIIAFLVSLSCSVSWADFPTTSVIDNFNRASLGASWDNYGTANFSISSNQVVEGGDPDSYVFNGMLYGTAYGPNLEYYITVVDQGSDAEIYLLVGNADNNGYAIYYAQDSSVQRIYKVVGSSINSTLASGSLSLSDGDKLGIEIISGVITLKYYSSGAWHDGVSVSDSTYQTNAKYFNIWVLESGNSIIFDDFGGGTPSGVVPCPYYRTIMQGEGY